MCILKAGKSGLWKKIRLTALGTQGLYSFSQRDISCNCAVLPLSIPVRCSSLLETSLQVGICARRALGFSEEQPDRVPESCGWEDVEICLEGNNLRVSGQAEHGLGVPAWPELLWTSRRWGLVLQWGSQATITESLQNHLPPSPHHTVPHEGA